MRVPLRVLLRMTPLAACFGLVFAVSTEAHAQPVDEDAAWVYGNYNKIPWSRVDSLSKLLKLYPMIEKAKEMGHILDRRWLVHDTGNEYNVVIETVYPSWEAMGEGARMGEVFRALEADSARRAEVNAGFNWVFQDTDHYDVIYRVMDTP